MNVALRKSFDGTEDFRLLDLPDELVKRLEEKPTAENGRKRQRCLDIKEPLMPQFSDVGAFICDNEKSYALRRVEFSNSIFVGIKRSETLELDGEGSAAASRGSENMTTTILEERLKRQFEGLVSRPRTEIVRFVLERNFLTLKEIEDREEVHREDTVTKNDASSRSLSFADLLAKVPLAELELKKCLIEMNAVVFDEKIRLLHPSTVSFAVNAIVTQLASHEDAVDKDGDEGESKGLVKIAALLTKGFDSLVPSAVFGVALRTIGTIRLDGSTMEQLLQLDATKILLALAERRLTTLQDEEDRDGCGFGPIVSKTDVMLNTLLVDVKLKLPAFTASTFPDDAAIIAALKGHVVLCRVGTGAAAKVLARWCPHYRLPHAVAGRVRFLFGLLGEAKGGAVTGTDLRWDKEEMRAFVEPLLEPGVTLDAALAKICREHRKPGEPTAYSLI